MLNKFGKAGHFDQNNNTIVEKSVEINSVTDLASVNTRNAGKRQRLLPEWTNKYTWLRNDKSKNLTFCDICTVADITILQLQVQFHFVVLTVKFIQKQCLNSCRHYY